MVLVKRFFKTFKRSSLYRKLANRYFHILILIVLCFFSISQKSIFILIVFLALWLCYFIQDKAFAVLALVVVGLVFGRYVFRKKSYQHQWKQYQDTPTYEGIAKIEKIKKTAKHFQILLRLERGYALYYSENKLNIGDIYYIQGEVISVDQSHYPGGFDYQAYLFYQNIYGQIEIREMTYVKHTFGKYQLYQNMSDYYEHHFHTESVGMIQALTIGNKDGFDTHLLEQIATIGVSHLFVISGLHVGLLVGVLEKLLSLLRIKKNYIPFLSIPILLLYYVISGFMVSVLRVVNGFILKMLNQQYQLKFSAIDLISINAYLVLCLNPMYIFQYNFMLSYLIAIGIILCAPHLSNGKGILGKIKNNITISCIAILITLPVVTVFSPDISFLAILYNLIYIPVVSYILLPLAFLVTCIPWFESLFMMVYSVFQLLTNHLAKIHFLTFTYPLVPSFIIVLYYFLFYWLIQRKQTIRKYASYLFILLQFIWIYWGYGNVHERVYFLDLPKGEATFIQGKHNQLNILIDTGEASGNDLIVFLKKQGVKRIDAIIISHGDSDHNGMLLELIQTFQVKQVYGSKYDTTTYQMVKDRVQYQVLSVGDRLTYQNNQFQILSPTKDYQNKNNNSLVILAHLFGQSYLFTGDIEKEVEKQLSKIGKVDYLKVPHHGSTTSSTDALFQNVQYDIAICMNGYQNRFSFPSPKIVERYKETIWITSEKGTIIIEKKRK